MFLLKNTPPEQSGGEDAMKGKKEKLGLIFFPAYDWAISDYHPEREERLLYTHDQLMEEGIFDFPGIKEYRPIAATAEDVLRVHICPPGVDKVAAAPHLISAGGAITAGRLWANKEVDKAFALVRPPGHHATLVVHGGRGFCNINNEAIMIEKLREEFGIKKVAIVDTDCHHGDGSQDIYWHDPDTLFISIHQDGRTLYPGTGDITEMGGPKAWGATINIPLPPATGDEGFLRATRQIVRPLLDEFQPELVVNSAGQDNHFTDPITNMKLTARGYAEMSAIINPDVAVLEGGYAIQGALPFTNMAIIMSMAGLDWRKVNEPMPSQGPPTTDPRVLDYIDALTESIMEMRANPKPEKSGSVLRNGWWQRDRRIFCDTHPVTRDLEGMWPSYLNEHRKESLRDCPDCPGLLVVETSSEVCKGGKYFKLPRQACDKCKSLAAQVNYPLG
ncbi:MAG: histone deacetylase [Deltaproteobacteria bacterium]|jgi:acetoin utilization deacetylase AcuC-like enzyme|nr:histone deacetylase [Deltaproteobacteria bacterium]